MQSGKSPVQAYWYVLYVLGQVDAFTAGARILCSCSVISKTGRKISREELQTGMLYHRL